MRALAIVHQPDAGPGVFAEALRSRGVELDQWLIPDGPPPAEPSGYDAVLTFGGAMHADQEADHPWLQGEKSLLAELIDRRVPLLGMCLGSQLVAEAAGTAARRASAPEIGWHEVELTPAADHDPLLAGLPRRFEAFQWHSYETPLPPGATALARSPVCLQAYRLEGPVWGIQFHAEVSAEDAEHWIDDYRSDPDAVRVGLDADSLRQRTRAAIADWNRLGRALCERFLGAISA
ncbi:MAG TPA: type 1 glutamine amidotransferase [Solirubrobacterales bacterium]|nr:type 1 glutamine amidotransferase [Solirubrobacterales bacterium]